MIVEYTNAYINDATKHNDPVISTHSDGFNGALRHGGGLSDMFIIKQPQCL